MKEVVKTDRKIDDAIAGTKRNADSSRKRSPSTPDLLTRTPQRPPRHRRDCQSGPDGGAQRRPPGPPARTSRLGRSPRSGRCPPGRTSSPSATAWPGGLWTSEACGSKQTMPRIAASPSTNSALSCARDQEMVMITWLAQISGVIFHGEASSSSAASLSKAGNRPSNS